MKIVKEQFFGAWSLLSWVQMRGEEQHLPIGDKPDGKIIFTDFGLVAVSIADKTRAKLVTGDFSSANIVEKAAAFERYLGYIARYELLDGRIKLLILNCSYPNWIGQEQVRVPAFDEDHLTLRAPPREVNGVPVSAALTWRRDIN